jgi:hypothetical protein
MRTTSQMATVGSVGLSVPNSLGEVCFTHGSYPVPWAEHRAILGLANFKYFQFGKLYPPENSKFRCGCISVGVEFAQVKIRFMTNGKLQAPSDATSNAHPNP